MGIPTNFAGKYKHIKGKCYEAICVARDLNDNELVLYKQLYDNYGYWVRPIESFFETIPIQGKVERRFAPTKPEKLKHPSVGLSKILDIIEDGTLSVCHSETKEWYTIIGIDTREGSVRIQKVSSYTGGYLSDYEIATRLGLVLLIKNGSTALSKRKQKVSENESLAIGTNNVEALKNRIGPCSVDLPIDDKVFLRTRRRVVDLKSINYVSNKAEDLWKDVSRKDASGNSYVKIRPGQTVLTRTRDKIKIPSDCAGKVEVKSTFARLSLSVTFGDFCNPGYYGHFPLEITNYGNHTVVIHSGEVMAQLILIPLGGPSINNYTQKGTYINGQGFDEGTPYAFWKEKSIKEFRSRSGTQKILELYDAVIEKLNNGAVEASPALRSRFEDTFISFCEKRLSKRRYMKHGSPDLVGLAKSYVVREKRRHTISKAKWGSIVPSLLALIKELKNMSLATMALAVIFAVPAIVWILRPNTVYCTFDNIDIEEEAKRIEAKS